MKIEGGFGSYNPGEDVEKSAGIQLRDTPSPDAHDDEDLVEPQGNWQEELDDIQIGDWLISGVPDAEIEELVKKSDNLKRVAMVEYLKIDDNDHVRKEKAKTKMIAVGIPFREGL